MTEDIVIPEVVVETKKKGSLPTPAQKEQSQKDVAGGITQEEAAKKNGTTPQTVGRQVKEAKGLGKVMKEVTKTTQARSGASDSLAAAVKRIQADPALTAKAVVALKKILQDDLDAL